MRGYLVVNDQAKKYTIKELTDILDTVDNVVRKKVKKYQFSTSQDMINGRLTTVVELTNDQIEALIKEIKFNKNTYKLDNSQLISDKTAINEQIKNNTTTAKEKDNVLDFDKTDQQTTSKLVEMLAVYAEKAGKYELLNDKSKEEKENTKFWQDKYFEKDNEIKELIKLNAELKAENQKLKEELQKKSGFMGFFKK